MSRMLQGAKGNTVDKNVLPSFIAPPVGSWVEAKAYTFQSFFLRVSQCLSNVAVTGHCLDKGDTLPDVLETLQGQFRKAHKKGKKIIFIGNGGSSAIASHMAIDWTKNGGIRAVALNDAPTLTCLGNDFGYKEVFAKQIEYYASMGDWVVIVSSSGKSPNILRAGEAALDNGCELVTLSGMDNQNLLRRMGGYNFYVPCMDYGLVEIAHLCILHSIVSVTL